MKELLKEYKKNDAREEYIRLARVLLYSCSINCVKRWEE